MFSIGTILLHENVKNKYDIEMKYRFYKLNFKSENVRQTSAMFHIWKQCNNIRFNLEFIGMILLALSFSIFTLLYLTI